MLAEPVAHPNEGFRSPPSLEHCAELLRDHGIVQFAHGREADLDSGFCLDDNARALLVSIAYQRTVNVRNTTARNMGDAALAFVHDASSVADVARGGCQDGVTASGTNPNMGAEIEPPGDAGADGRPRGNLSAG